ncbi:MAG: NAD-dependent epimerase/dehydratase family protein [Candidatus Cyclobacteriaceae bacterium M3_2C_046]
MSFSISVLGCGWLGFPLAQALVEQGYQVKGSTTTFEKIGLLKKVSVEPFLIKLDPEPDQSSFQDFFQSSLLIINIPPQTRQKSPSFHPQQVRHILSYCKTSPVQEIIFISSTSVYPEQNQTAREEDQLDPQNGRQRAILEAEKLIINSGISYNILRCGGLMGYDRNPKRFLSYLKAGGKVSGTKMRSNPDTPVNYIHRDDVISIIVQLIKTNIRNEIFNLVAPKHPLRRVFIDQEVNADNSAIETKYKIVDSGKLQKVLSYQFRHPDPLKF